MITDHKWPTDITEILRDIAAERKTSVGDLWTLNCCNDAADYIDKLRGEMYVVHMDTDILFTGTQEECQAHKDKQDFNNFCWKVHSLAEYGRACYTNGYEDAEVVGPEY